jgi:ribonuclease HI
MVPGLLGDGVVVYCDGSAVPNPGRGGFAALVFDGGFERAVLSGGFTFTTNNRMELWGALAALEAIGERRRITVVTDSRYLKAGANWAPRWRDRDWRASQRYGGRSIRNMDLWRRLLLAIERHERVVFQWTRGHRGDALNERADRLAREAGQAAALIDPGWP